MSYPGIIDLRHYLMIIENNPWYKNAWLAILLSLVVGLIIYYGSVLVLQRYVRALEVQYREKKSVMVAKNSELSILQKKSGYSEDIIVEDWLRTMQTLAKKHHLRIVQLKQLDGQQTIACQFQGRYQNVLLLMGEFQKYFAGYISLHDLLIKGAGNGVDVLFQMIFAGL